jgi:hypothetical protein
MASKDPRADIAGMMTKVMKVAGPALGIIKKHGLDDPAGNNVKALDEIYRLARLIRERM